MTTLAPYSAILVETLCPTGRPGPFLMRAMAAVTPVLQSSAVASLADVERIVVFLTVTETRQLRLVNKGVRGSTRSRRDLCIDVIVPTWCLNETNDTEFSQLCEGAMLLAIAMVTSKYRLDPKSVLQAIEDKLSAPRIAAMFAPELVILANAPVT